MKRLALGIIIGGIIGAVLILIIIVVFDTKKRKGQEGLRLVTNDTAKASEPKKQQQLVYGDYMDLDSTNYLLIPLGMKTVEENENRLLKNKASEEYSTESYIGSYRSYRYNFYTLDFGNCNNIIFYNKKNEDTHLLLQKPAVIAEFYFPFYNAEYKAKKYWFLLFGIHESDSNDDGYINDEDAETVYISNLSGQNMISITPENTQLVDWYIDEATNNILMKVRLDSNNDKKFSATDDIEILKTAISTPQQGLPIIGEGIKKDIKKILEQIK
ncbi:MAG: hypothetical protein WAQ28_19855 [Bacteroidia bacterium]|jgi:hypothetical protein